MLYKAKGYSDDWIEKRMRGINIREELTDEWKKRGVEKHRDYAILTAEISKATFGTTPSEYKKMKNLKKDAKEGGKIAGDAKKALEIKTGKNVSTSENYKNIHNSPTLRKEIYIK